MSDNAHDASAPHAAEELGNGRTDTSRENVAGEGPSKGNGADKDPLGGAGVESAGPRPEDAAAPSAAPGLDKLGVIGHAVWLMTQVPTHRHLFITDLEWALIPPVSLGQFRIWRKKGVPVAFATWAYLDPAAEKRLISGVHKLKPIDWKSGEALWLMDVLAPFGGQEQVVKELREQMFPGRTLKTLQPAPGGGMAVVEW